ncbi:MAG: glycerol kinase GlpK [Acidimicrobiia bacterium]|nr:glycerol kinase GlpK [Acidimicrobiia bacterium]
MTDLVGALDQGTTSTRFMLFDRSGSVVSTAQEEHRQIFPQPGWVEHDPNEITTRMWSVIESALDRAGVDGSALAAVGITNQRETAVVWDRSDGSPVANAIVWQDTRTAELCERLGAGAGQDRFRAKTGLPLATYFSGPKVRWLLDSRPDLSERSRRGDLAFGTIDSWVLWQLTGGAVHATDVTNASRTMLMDLVALDWDEDMLGEVGVPAPMLPEIRPSVGPFGVGIGPLEGVPVTGILGDQQAALFGQTCFDPGDAKNTYGTGCFMLLNTGTELIHSANGLLTTVGYRIGSAPAVYALEGSIAIAGALVQWLRDNLGIIETSAQIEALAASVPDNGDVYFVPAFSGLFAPHWRADARGAVVGMTRFTTKAHLARAALEATAFQTREVLDAMKADSGVALTELRVDGGMVGNELLMQFQADVLGVPVVRPLVSETTALGAAYAAGLGVGLWDSPDDLRANWGEDRRWLPSPEGAESLFARWQQAVQRTFDWV